MKHTLVATSVLGLSMLLGACASPGYYNQPVAQPYPSASYPAPSYPATSPSYSYARSSGVIDAIRARAGSADNGMGAGAVVGGVVGGLLGHQVGGGRGKTAATVAGAIGGVMLGNQMERDAQARGTYEIGIRLDNGSYQTVVQENVADLYVGSRVRLENGRVYRY